MRGGAKERCHKNKNNKSASRLIQSAATQSQKRPMISFDLHTWNMFTQRLN